MPHPKDQVECTCEQCGAAFSLKRSAAKNRRYCNAKCRADYGESIKVVTKCPSCGKKVKSYKRNPRIYCSMSCAITVRNRTDANPSKHRDLSGPNNPMFGKGHLLAGEKNGMYGRTGDQSPSWKGGRKIRADGYILAYAPDHPNAISNGDGTRTYVLEHRLVMEQHLGRFLTEDEVVHHIDGNPSNNDITNLELFESHSEHLKSGH